MLDIRFHHREWPIFKRGCSSVCSGSLRCQDQQYNSWSWVCRLQITVPQLRETVTSLNPEHLPIPHQALKKLYSTDHKSDAFYPGVFQPPGPGIFNSAIIVGESWHTEISGLGNGFAQTGHVRVLRFARANFIAKIGCWPNTCHSYGDAHENPQQNGRICGPGWVGKGSPRACEILATTQRPSKRFLWDNFGRSCDSSLFVWLQHCAWAD